MQGTTRETGKREPWRRRERVYEEAKEIKTHLGGAISLKLSTHVQQEVVGDAEPRQRTQIVLACRRRRQ